MICVLKAHLKIIFNTDLYSINCRTVLTQKNKTDTETLRLVYNKFKFDNNYANKTRR